MNKKSYLTVEEVAQQFGVNPTTIYRLASRGKIPGFKIGNQWRFDPAMLEAWIRSQGNVSPESAA